MHESDVIHRDVKPDNLLITEWSPVLQVKICDFGQAERNGTDDHNRYIGGTEGYCSPEYMDGSGHGPCIDMWSLGITLYELLFGCLPFDQENARDAEINMHDRDISGDAADLILQLLHRNHMERINARGVLNHQWIKTHVCKAE